MLRFLSSCLVLGIVLACPKLARADDAARAVIERGWKAQGGTTFDAEPGAMKSKIKGVMHAGKEETPVTGELISQYPLQFKRTIEAGGPSYIDVLNGKQAWERVNGDVAVQLQGDDLERLKREGLVKYVTTLAPLLQENKEFSLSLAGEAKVQGHGAVGVKVQSAGKPDVTLYFDKETGLLTKSAYMGLNSEAPMGAPKKEVLREDFYSDYREVNIPTPERERLQKAGIGTDDESLLGFLRKRIVSEEEQAKLAVPIRNLGDSSFEVREKAKAAVVARGWQAFPLLARALKDADPERCAAAQQCLERLGKVPDAANISAVVQLLARRRSSEALEGLLAYLPSAPNEQIDQEVRGAIAAVWFRAGKPDKALTKALEDKNPIRREVAKALLESKSQKDSKKSPYKFLALGYKVPMKGQEFVDGVKTYDWEATEVQLFNKLDDSVFGKP
ncbi:MAG TPA: hypothetical protein VK395_01765 [Gemmataceae bacterium]|nr:hypothetical protein [Gemmataceae bacterium]